MASDAAASGLTIKLADFYSTMDYEDLSPQVVDRAKYFCLDYLSVAMRGSRTPSAAAMQRAIGTLSRDGDSVVMGTSLRAAPEYAALANGTAGHSLEIDDVSNDASLHPGVVTFPAAFACADMEPVSGRELITAITAGYDLTIRLGRALDPRHHYARGFHPTATCGTFGATIVACRLLGLDAGQSVSALGIAGSQAAGSLEFLAEGAWTKRMHPGWASHSGMIAAAVAKEGFTGPTSIFEGRNGFLHGYSDDADSSKALESLGEVFYINKVGIKPHGCCRYKQGPIDCILEIRREHDLKAEEVETVTIGVLDAGFNVVAAPEEQKRNPRNLVEAQFSMPFGAAVAILYGRASLDEYTEDTMALSQVNELMSKVRCVRDPSLEVNYPSQWPAWVEAETRDGRQLRAEVIYPKGDPENALSWDELRQKFRGLTGPVIPSDRQEEIISAVESLEGLSDVRLLAQLTSV